MMLRGRPGRYREVHLRIAGLDQVERTMIEAQMNDLLAVCGCSASGIAVGLVILTAGPFFGIGLWHGTVGWPSVSIAIGGLAMVAVAGKLAVVGIARLRLRRLVGRLQRCVISETKQA